MSHASLCRLERLLAPHSHSASNLSLQHHALATVLSGDADSARTVRRLAMAKALTWEDPAQAAKFQDVDFALMEREISETRAMCESTHSPVVYSHNDLLPGNIMALHPPGEPAIAPAMHLQFIDFEYGCYGFRGFDWGASCLLPPGLLLIVLALMPAHETAAHTRNFAKSPGRVRSSEPVHPPSALCESLGLSAHRDLH